jgi:hypothetical protein
MTRGARRSRLRLDHLTDWILASVKDADDNNLRLFSAVVDEVLFHESAATTDKEVVSRLTEIGIIGKKSECIG